MDDVQDYRLAGQVIALELVVRTIIGGFLAMHVTDENGFTEAAAQAERLRRMCMVQVKAHLDQMPEVAMPQIVALRESITETVERCFQQAIADMNRTALGLLALADPASDATN